MLQSAVNPVPVMKLVELIPALQTTPDVLERARAFAVAMGKTVTVSQDTPGQLNSGLPRRRDSADPICRAMYVGFVSNRLLMPFINEAIIALESVRAFASHPLAKIANAEYSFPTS